MDFGWIHGAAVRVIARLIVRGRLVVLVLRVMQYTVLTRTKLRRNFAWQKDSWIFIHLTSCYLGVNVTPLHEFFYHNIRKIFGVEECWTDGAMM